MADAKKKFPWWFHRQSYSSKPNRHGHIYIYLYIAGYTIHLHLSRLVLLFFLFLSLLISTLYRGTLMCEM